MNIPAIQNSGAFAFLDKSKAPNILFCVMNINLQQLPFLSSENEAKKWRLGSSQVAPKSHRLRSYCEIQYKVIYRFSQVVEVICR